MTQIVKDIFKAVKDRSEQLEVNKILLVNNKYVVVCLKNGQPLIDGLLLYDDGELVDYAPGTNMKAIIKASKNPVYSK